MHMCMGTILKEHTLNCWQGFSLKIGSKSVVILLNSHSGNTLLLYQIEYSILYFTIIKLHKKTKVTLASKTKVLNEQR